MITNFEEITKDLNDDEKKLIPIIIKSLKKYTKSNPIREPEIVKGINENKDRLNLKNKFTGVRLRKLINFIRSNAMLPVIGTSKGYYVTDDHNEVMKQIKSMKERNNQVQRAINGLEQYLMKNI